MASRFGLALTTALLIGPVAWLTVGHLRHPGPGVTVPEEPVQGPPDIAATANPWPVADNTYQAVDLASYHLRGRVLSATHYTTDGGAPIAPYDLALGWGRMSDWSVYDRLGISQRGRFYLYQWGAEGPPIPRGEIITHSANNHIIPANPEVLATLRRVRRHDIVRLDGHLVEVRGANGYRWRSSLTRTDTGGNACELFRVSSMEIEPPDF